MTRPCHSAPEVAARKGGARPLPVLDRIIAFSAQSEGGCWEWQRGINHLGYGRLRVNGKDRTAHRAAYEALVGPVPAGLVLDHLCRNRRCCNPAHLEPVTPRVNTLRGTGLASLNAVKTHCSRGHEYNAENTYIGTRGRRDCRICKVLRVYKSRSARIRANSGTKS